MRSWLISLAVLPLLGACAHGLQDFRPADRVSGLDVEGNPAALYVLRGPSGVFGEVQLSSRGATMAERDGGERTYLHVGIELHNTGAEPLTMKRAEVRLLDVRVDGEPLSGELAPLPVADLSVPPQGSARWQLFFPLPEDVRPYEIDAFVVRWSVTGPNQRYARRTLFLEREPVYGPGYGVYDIHHPYYWHFRRWGYCADPFCNTVFVGPRYRYYAPSLRDGRPSGNRTRTRGR